MGFPMTRPVLATKLHIPPLRPDRVKRPRLIEQLNLGLNGSLTLVSAPAGFGKTTLLSEWAAQCDRPVGWVSLDKGDNDPARFWSYVIAACRTIQPDVGTTALAMLDAPRAHPSQAEMLLTELINDLIDRSAASVIVLDDYHLVETAAIHEALTFLFDPLPADSAGPHLVLAGRADPPLPLARLRGRGQLTELRAADLTFTPDEAASFLNDVMDLGLTNEDIEALEERTEGWIVALQAAAL